MAERAPAQCWLTDMDGVLVHEGLMLPGADEFIRPWSAAASATWC